MNEQQARNRPPAKDVRSLPEPQPPAQTCTTPKPSHLLKVNVANPSVAAATADVTNAAATRMAAAAAAAAAAATTAAAADAAAKTMTYEDVPRKKSSENGDDDDYENEDDDDEDDADQLTTSGVGPVNMARRRDSFVPPVNPQDVLTYLKNVGQLTSPGGGTRHETAPERKLKEGEQPQVKDLYIDNEKINVNRSYKLRYNFMRKQGAVPSSMRDHMDRFKKPPFKRVWRPGWCFDNINDRLARLSNKQKKF